jgi:hypothetical protein
MATTRSSTTVKPITENTLSSTATTTPAVPSISAGRANGASRRAVGAVLGRRTWADFLADRRLTGFAAAA